MANESPAANKVLSKSGRSHMNLLNQVSCFGESRHNRVRKNEYFILSGGNT